MFFMGGSKDFYTAEKYTRLVENSRNDLLRSYMEAESLFVSRIESPGSKTFIDLGAGHGRATKLLAEISRNLISVEINPDMLVELRNRSSRFENSKVIEGDVRNIASILSGQDMSSPVFLLLQNTLPLIDGWAAFLSELRKTVQSLGGEVVLSLFRQGALESGGVEMYDSLREMVGTPLPEKCDFDAGLMVTDTGYTSKWWTDDEIRSVLDILGGRIADELKDDAFQIFRLKFD